MHLFGVWGERRAGVARLGTRVLPVSDPKAALRAGLALVTEDRRRYGLTIEQSIGFNLSLSSLRKISVAGLVQSSREYTRNHAIAQSLQIKAASIDSIAGQLSGGNQQKVVLGKWLAMSPRVLILDEPTRGIDVGAKSEIYRHMSNLASQGITILMVSSEMEEIIGMSNRVVVMHERGVKGILSAGELTQERIAQLMTGNSNVKKEASA
jgi:D-xylose transport system ATP-binding protein